MIVTKEQDKDGLRYRFGDKLCAVGADGEVLLEAGSDTMVEVQPKMAGRIRHVKSSLDLTRNSPRQFRLSYRYHPWRRNRSISICVADGIA